MQRFIKMYKYVCVREGEREGALDAIFKILSVEHVVALEPMAESEKIVWMGRYPNR